MRSALTGPFLLESVIRLAFMLVLKQPSGAIVHTLKRLALSAPIQAPRFGG